MCVAVMVMLVLNPAGQLFRRHNTSLCLAATDVLKLDGGVADVKMLAQEVVELVENAHAF